MTPRDGLLASVRIDDLPRRRVCRVGPETPLGEVYRLLAEERSVAVLVEEEGRPAGIFTERDVLLRTALEGDRATPIRELMTQAVVTLRPDQPVTDAVAAMTDKKIRHIPLLTEEGGEAGMIGGRDILRLLSDYFPETLLNLPPRLHQTLDRPEGG